MAFTSRKNLYVHWQELKPIEKRMTAADKAWFTLFLQAYYLRIRSSLEQLTQDPDVMTSVWTEAVWISNEGRRDKSVNTRPYGSDYSAADWDESDASMRSAEDAIIEAIDYQRSITNGKAQTSDTQAEPATSRKNSRTPKSQARNSNLQGNDCDVRQGKARAVVS